MSSINGVSGTGNPWAALNTQRQARMFAKADSDGSGSVDKAELSTVLSKISEKTGVSLDGNIDDTFSKMDSNGDGSLSSDELAQGMQSLMPPPPSTMDFAQGRGDASGGDKSDDLFAKIDTNGDGSIDKTEMAAFTDKMKKAHADKDASGTTNASGSDDFFSKLDTDGDGKLTQAEFDAGRPEKSTHGGPNGPDGPPPAGGPGGPGGAGGTKSASSSDSKTYDPLDTNQDGVVSELERLVGELKDASSALSGDSANSSSAQADIAKLAKQLYEQFSAGWSQQSTSTLSALA